MLKGDLTSTPLAPLLLELADDSATGCLVITDSTEDEALVYFKNGLVYSVAVPGSRPQLGAKLVSSGALAPEALSEALEAQRSELQGWRLGELLVHLGYVDQPVVEAFVAEQVSEALWDLLRWSDGRWRFRKNVKAREDVGPPMAIVDLLETLRERGYVWETISAVVHGPSAVPRLSTRGDTSNETTLDNDAWSMLCKIDGERSVAELAADCGYTLFEAGHVIVSLVQAGLVDIDEDIDVEGSALYGATTLSSALSGDLDDATFTPAAPDDEDALSKLARLVNEVAGTGDETDPATAAPAAAEAAPVAPNQRQDRELDNAMTVSVNRHSGESFAASIARVSGALSEVLGEVPPPDIDPEELAARRRRSATSTIDPEWQRRKRLRTAAAAELASAQALIETLRPDRDITTTPPPTPEFTGDVPKVVSRATERERAVARDAEEASRHAAEEAAREAAEQFARAAAEEADRVAAEQETARIAAERAAAEQAARLEAEAANAEAEEAARLAAEQAAAAEAARLAAEAEALAAEVARVHAERDAAEEAAWAEYWQREEAERAAAAEAARVAAELEAARVAAEEAERQAQAQAQAEAERAAAEQLAQLAEAQAEADRIAAEQAAQLAEAQAEAERIAAEEAERVAKAEAAARRKAEKAAAAEAAKRDDEAASASALLAEFAASSAPAEPESAADVDQEPEYDLAPEEHAEAEVREPVTVGGGWSDADTDTASLLRELSSLGGDDDDHAPSGPAIPSRPRPNAPDKKVKKKIGLFGL
jgi:hypothetical protein